MLAVGAGLTLFFAGSDTAVATAPDPRRGNLLALASGVTFALVLTGLRWQGRQGGADSGIATVAAGNLIACVVALPMALPLHNFTARDAAVILYLGAAQVGLAYWCLTRALRHVPAFEATTMLQVEPAMNPVWSWLAHGERPSAVGIRRRCGDCLGDAAQYVVWAAPHKFIGASSGTLGCGDVIQRN